VHRPHTIIGKAVDNAMNMRTTLAAYATICRETGRPFQFPGSQVQWEGLTDMTDARLLARHMLWTATEPAAANMASKPVSAVSVTTLSTRKFNSTRSRVEGQQYKTVPFRWFAATLVVRRDGPTSPQAT